ncbi:MAG: hypothetical protein KY458_03385 [Actinobacteria bacterium]|nr:hypothetical protein [Actinomycetota bacterium]
MSERTSDDDLARLTSNIAEELRAQSALRDLGLSEVTIEEVASAIAVNIDYAFTVAWSPRWVKPGDAHYGMEPDSESPTGENHFVECLQCQWVCASNPSRRDAEQKYGRHLQREHTSPS